MKAAGNSHADVGIHIEHHLFVWFSRELDATPPRIAVNRSIEFAKDLLLVGVLEGTEFSGVPITWDEIMSSIRWADMHQSDGPHCGLKLMRVMGRFNKAFRPYRRYEERQPWCRARAQLP